MADALAGTLDGYHVVALVLNVPGPLAGARLRALGARVTKIEPARGDPLAASSPSWYASIIAGMEVLRIDLRAHAGAATLDALLREADVLLSSVRARTLERLGLDSHRLHSRQHHRCRDRIRAAVRRRLDAPGRRARWRTARVQRLSVRKRLDRGCRSRTAFRRASACHARRRRRHRELAARRVRTAQLEGMGNAGGTA
jgi:hypothetical protein